MITIIDYGMGNLRSVQKGFEFVGYQANITGKKEEILNADAVVLPGVGAFKDAMNQLKKRDLIDTIKAVADNGTPFLGICLGMQLLFESSEEDGPVEGLGILPGKIIKLPLIPGLKVPHMGWNETEIEDNIIFENIKKPAYFYYVHSFYLDADSSDNVIARCNHGVKIGSAVNKDNIFAFQFHPEKSSDNGLSILKKFGELGENK